MSKYDVKEIEMDVSNIPQEWIYKSYYKRFTGNTINQPFDGRIIKVKSVINRDSNPSLCFFYKNGNYFWRDFSHGVGGNAVAFVSFHLSKYEVSTHFTILKDYNEYISNGVFDHSSDIEMSEIQKPEYVLDLEPYNDNSLDYWKRFKISKETLDLFKVKRCPEYHMFKQDRKFVFHEFAFAYFNRQGPYQLYQPNNNKAKYINIDTSYLIGGDQLQFKSDVCLIISGLKDIMAISEVGINCEYVASSSENSPLTKEKVEFLKCKYKFVISMLDNDQAGIKAMMRYNKIYNIPFIIPKLKQDLAKNNESYPLEKLRYTYTQLIHKKINNSE